MSEYYIIEIICKLATPIVVNSALHFDSLLSAVHPAMCNQQKVTRFDKDNTNIKQAPLPLMSAKIGDDWVWAATAAEFPDCAILNTDKMIKRWTPDDIHTAQRTLKISIGALRNRFIDFTTVITPYITFYAAVQSPTNTMKLLKRVQSVGHLRKSGYGMVAEWHIKSINLQWQELLVLDGITRRNLPATFIEDTSKTHLIRTQPPYWHNSDKILGVDTGTENIALSHEVYLRGKIKGKEYEFKTTAEEWHYIKGLDDNI